MQAQPTLRSFAVTIPSFMSVFQEDTTQRQGTPEEGQQGHGVSAAQPALMVNSPLQATFGPLNRPFHTFHQPRDSTSTSASDSPDSSPTTSYSTVDSASVAESSPSTSPETPVSTNIPPLCVVMDGQRVFQPPERIKVNPNQGTFFEMQRPITPGKKARNLKNLAVVTNTLSRPLVPRALSLNSSPAPEPQNAAILAGVSSPVFVKPPTPPRRKMSNLGLSIMTPANGNVPRLAIPPTPSFKRPLTLKHSQSTPVLATFPSNPLSPESSRISAQRARAMGFADPVQEDDEEEEPNFDIPQSQEEKPESYPHGPIRIYESGIDLYYEPSAEVASRYDVIFNVASEVKNPFTQSIAGAESIPLTDAQAGQLAAPKPSQSPDTPKVNSSDNTELISESKQPEYIHIPWEHNTDIVHDLCKLVKIMEAKIEQGKRVLVHCQCGVSRSASLIVAYGLYKNPELSVQEAYDAVKKRSKWIAPNMSLIMQLQEFRSKQLTTNGMNRGTGFSDDFVEPTAHTNSTHNDSNLEFSGILSSPITHQPYEAQMFGRGSLPERPIATNIEELAVKPAPQIAGFTRSLPFRRSWGTSPVRTEFGSDAVDSQVVVDVPPRAESETPKGIAISMPPELPDSQIEATVPPARPATPPQQLSQVPAKRKTPNFSRQLPLRRDWPLSEAVSSTSIDSMTQTSIISPRSEHFHFTPLAGGKPSEIESGDSFGILSPIRTEFPSNAFDSLLPPAPATSSYENQENDQSLFLSNPPAPKLKPSFLSLTPVKHEPASPISSFMPSLAAPTPEPTRTLKPKFSSPNLQQQLRLRRMQSTLETKLSKKQAANKQRTSYDDIDAIMSPRVTEFTNNPFHKMLEPTATIEKPEEVTHPLTREATPEDPRSPPLLGGAPIIRNIDGLL